MMFLLDLELAPKDDGEPFTIEQVLTHLREYTFAEDTEFEMSLVPGDPDHELDSSNYRIFTVTRVDVKSADIICPKCGSEDTWPQADSPEGVMWFCAHCGADFEVKS